ncbi:MAG: DUF4097 family beta strand repeat-containing protein [Deinococcales bacterium]
MQSLQAWLKSIDQSRSWLPLGGYLLLLLFTPLGTIWWLCLMILAVLFLAQRLQLSTTLLWALVTLAGGILTAGAWNPRTLSPNLRNAPEDRQGIVWANIERLEIKNFNGLVRINVLEQGGDLQLERRGGASVVLERRGNTIALTARRPFFSVSSGVDVILNAPPNLLVNVQNSNGAVRLEGAVRELNIRTSNGRIEVRDSGKTRSYLETSNGEIVLEGLSGELIAKTSNARIRLTNSQDLRLSANTSNADVQLENVLLQNNSNSKIETSNGVVQLQRLAASSGLSIVGSTSNAKPDIDAPGFDVRLEEQRFEATRDGFGMARLEVQTSNKSIVLR